MVVVIPAYEPNEELENLVSELNCMNYRIVIVNDGSSPDKNVIFERLRFRLIINESSKRGRHKKVKIMMTSRNEENLRTLAMLRYQADRYQSVGNGSMCQRVNAEIRRLVSQMSESSKN